MFYDWSKHTLIIMGIQFYNNKGAGSVYPLLMFLVPSTLHINSQ